MEKKQFQHNLTNIYLRGHDFSKGKLNPLSALQNGQTHLNNSLACCRRIV